MTALQTRNEVEKLRQLFLQMPGLLYWCRKKCAKHTLLFTEQQVTRSYKYQKQYDSK